MIRRGEVYWAKLVPIEGSEIGKTRPAVVISNNINNEFADTVTVIPVTSSVGKVYPFEVSIPGGNGGLTADSRIKANQIRTIDKKRLVNFRYSLPIQFIPRVEQALKVHLNIH